MRRTLLALVSTVAGLVMLLSFKTHSLSPSAGDALIAASSPPSAVSSPSPSPSASTSAGTAATKATTPKTTTSTTAPPTTPASVTVTGDAVDTRYGPVQVKITVTNGKVTAAQAVTYPQNDRRDQEINFYAVPQLNREAVAAGSASIDSVSGATYTSDGYVTSLQSALDRARG